MCGLRNAYTVQNFGKRNWWLARNSLSLFLKPFKQRTMLIYNITYHAEADQAQNLYIWLHEAVIPEVEKSGFNLRNPRICRILTHRGGEGESLTIQWEVENSAELHRWHLAQGVKLDQEMHKIFKDQVVTITTLMEVLE